MDGSVMLSLIHKGKTISYTDANDMTIVFCPARQFQSRFISVVKKYVKQFGKYFLTHKSDWGYTILGNLQDGHSTCFVSAFSLKVDGKKVYSVRYSVEFLAFIEYELSKVSKDAMFDKYQPYNSKVK